jgi:CRP/FNR family transcriptional regulator, cyclic AMP receptor protein
MTVGPSDVSFYNFPIFHSLSETAIEEMMASGEKLHFEADSPIIISNDKGLTFFVILDGMAKVTLHRLPENDISLMLLKKGDFFGEMALLENTFSRTATVMSMTELDVLVISRDAFFDLMRKHPDLALNLARGLGQRIRQMNERMLALTLPTHKKISRTLMLVACKPPLDYPDPIVLPDLTKEEWLQFCYSNETELFDSLKDMEAAGAAKWEDGKMIILNVANLKEFAVGILPKK